VDVTAAHEEQLGLMLEVVDALAHRHIAPRAREIDETDEFPGDVYAAMGAAGLFGLWVPEEYGGLGADLRTGLLVVERLARTSGACSLIFANCSDGVGPLVMAGTVEQKERWLPGIATGDVIPCFALTEPDAGSDASAISTRAVRSGDEYVINGNKIFCTNGSVGHVFVVFARTSEGSRGLSAFLVPAGTDGLLIGKDEQMLGLRGCPATELRLDDVRVPASALLGEEGRGLKIALGSLDESRLNATAMALGVARGALEIAVRYAREREQFGVPIIDHQGLMFLLAEMTTSLYSAWATLGHAIDAMERERSRRTSVEAAMVKLHGTDVAMQLVVDAVQVLGGYGLARDFEVERMMRDAKAFQIFDGTNQIQKLIIGRALREGPLPLPSRW
jgi:alkylation response protein AidB-like acyl-CoA dehydrogenase